MNTDTGGALGDSAAVFGQFGDASGWFSPGSAGVRGDSAAESGVVGTTGSGEGVVGIASSGIGVYGSVRRRTRRLRPHQRRRDRARGQQRRHQGERRGHARIRAHHDRGQYRPTTTRIDHPLTDNDPNAILFVTHDYGASGPYHNSPVGVWYDAGKWHIYNENTAFPMTAGRRFNILVIKR